MPPLHRALPVLLLVALGCRSAPAPTPVATPGSAPDVSPEVAVPSAPSEPLPPEELSDLELGPGPDEAQATPIDLALEAAESARIFWESGDLENALAALDRAYGFMLEIPEDDAVSAQARDDLRQLVARRIVEMSASRRVAVGDIDRAIPLDLNEHVEREIASFTGPERSFFLESYRRAGLYRPMIVAELEARGLPEQLSWLPLVESGFKPRALSSARALGLWQFISSTAYRYGLSRDEWVDERMDPAKATGAAFDYLTDLHELFGDWLTALAAYNCGEGRVAKAIDRQRIGYLDSFWDLYAALPRETARYVPRLLAVLHIVADPDRYGLELPEPLVPPLVEEIVVDRSLGLGSLGGALELSSEALAALNPELRRDATPPRSYLLRVPAGEPGAAEVVASVVESAPPTPVTSTHRVRSGESLSVIAQRYGTSVSSIVAANDLRSADRIWPGQLLEVPGAGWSGGGDGGGGGEVVSYRVQRGDSLWLLARRFGTTTSAIQAANGLRTTNLRIGQVLEIGGSGAGSRSHVVAHGDTLSGIAQRYGVALERLLAANGLSRRSTIYPRQRLRIP